MARRTSSELAFSAIRIEGSLLATDFLDRVAHFDATEQAEADYDIPKGLKLRDEIGRYWKIAMNLWQDFQSSRGRTDVDAHAITANEFLEPLFRHVLEFADLEHVGKVTLGERVFPIGYQAADGRVPLIFAAHNQALEEGNARYGDGFRRRSPFLLTQEYLNASEDALWAIVTNGLKLRILRDNASMTRPAYIEVDLEAIFNEELYPDFTAFWLLAHATRFGKGGAPADCPLEHWRNSSQESGVRARDRLREGVGEALRALGTGFISHPQNAALRDKLDSGQLTPHALYEQLLRLVYRFIFLATVEDRRTEQGTRLVFAPATTLETMRLYEHGYSLTRLRELAAKRRHYDRHSDLWQALSITFEGLGEGQAALGLPALGGLFAADSCPDLDSAQLENRHLLQAVFSLCFFRKGPALSRVNYRDMDSEELGSVYESLLELVPQVEVAERRFSFIGDEDENDSTKGNARKLTGSYYTPDSLVQELIKSALDPVIEQTLRDNPQEPIQALLSLTVCDPACGSGHFLLAAARQLAEALAKLRAQDGNPTQDNYRHALREVIGHCIYGVDKNPMAVELARTALWLEAYTPDAPLTFLDHHLRCGDALLGVLDPKILEEGIPEKAFEVLSGDDKEIAKRLKVENRIAIKALKKLQSSDLFGLPAHTAAAETVETLPDDSLDALETKRARWHEQAQAARDSAAMRLADTYVAAFLMPKTAEREATIPLSGYFWNLAQGEAGDVEKLDAAAKICRAHQVFHWWLEFPHIHMRGGFSVLLGNPPWERIKLQEEEFFATRSPLVAKAQHKAERGELIALLKKGTLLHTLYPEVEQAQNLSPPNLAEQQLHAEFLAARRGAEAASLYAHDSGRYPLTGVGDVNTYALFAEAFSQLVAPKGRAGFIVPTGIATDDSTKAFFETVSQSGQLVSLFSFENESFIFPAVHHSFRFCILTLRGSSAIEDKAQFVFFARKTEFVHDARRRFTLTPDEFRLINPNTRTCPVFRSQRDAELTKKLYRAAPVLIEEGQPDKNPWGIRFQTMFHMSNDSGLFFNESGPTRLPLYEAKMIHQFDHRWATYETPGEDSRDVSENEKYDSTFKPQPRYWVEERQVLARIADVPRKLANAWLDGNDQDILEELALWLVGHLMNTVGLAHVQTELSRISRPLEAAARDSKKWQRAADLAAECALTEGMLKQLNFSGNEVDLLHLVDEWMDTRSPRWLMGWRDITSAHVLRTVIASVVPKVGINHKAPLFRFPRNFNVPLLACFFANLNSFVLDFCARQKVGGTSLTYFYMKQFPVLPPDRYTEADLAFIVPRVLELTYTSHDLKPWAEDLGHHGTPFEWNPERRAILRTELDAWYANLYELTREELRYILEPAEVMGEDYPSETFRVLKNSEIRQFGEYRTQRLVLDAWDRLAANSFTGLPYEFPVQTTEAPGTQLDYSEQGVIRNETEGRFAGLVLAILKLGGEMSGPALESSLATASQSDYVSRLLNETARETFQKLLDSFPGILDPTTIACQHAILQRLESFRTLSASRQGTLVTYQLTDGPVPDDVIQAPELEELAELVLNLETERQAQVSAKDQQLGDARGAVKLA